MTKKKAKRKSRPRARVRVDADEYDVGYRKPPRAYQFKPGQSGHPPGRRKGAKNEETILRELLQQKVRITENGKVRKITVLEAILRRIAEDSLRGNIKSIGFLLNRYYAAAAGGVAQADLSEDDKAVLDAYLRKLKNNPEDDGGEGQP
jgi:Family of unknown function (DUF5681)